jgi:hypothetical protein
MQAQRRRYVLIHEMAAVMKDFDMYLTASGDVGLTNQTGPSGGRVPVCHVRGGELATTVHDDHRWPVL